MSIENASVMVSDVKTDADVGLRLNVANPIGICTKTVRHDDPGTIVPVLDNLQYSLAPKARPV